MPGSTITQAGNYSLFIDTGFNVNAFVLDDYLKGVLDNTTFVLDGTDDYANVTNSLKAYARQTGPLEIPTVGYR